MGWFSSDDDGTNGINSDEAASGTQQDNSDTSDHYPDPDDVPEGSEPSSDT